MTKENLIKSFDTQFDKMFDVLCDLYFRWQDEKEYEDFDDYVAVMKKVFGDDEAFIKGTKRPFGCMVKLHDYQVQFKVNATSGNWKVMGKV